MHWRITRLHGLFLEDGCCWGCLGGDKTGVGLEDRVGRVGWLSLSWAVLAQSQREGLIWMCLLTGYVVY